MVLGAVDHLLCQKRFAVLAFHALQALYWHLIAISARDSSSRHVVWLVYALRSTSVSTRVRRQLMNKGIALRGDWFYGIGLYKIGPVKVVFVSNVRGNQLPPSEPENSEPVI